MGVRLPAEYQEVEYLEGQGAQWIQTNVRQRSGLRAKYRILFTSHISDTQQVFATNRGMNAKNLYFPYISSGKWYYGYDGAINTNVTVFENTIYEVDSTLDVGNQIVTVNGNTIANGSNTTNISTTEIMGLFANSNPNVPRFAYAKIYDLSVIDTSTDELVAEFIPCYRKSDSKPGMYDLISGTFFTNAGTGEFLVGPDVIDSISPWLVARRRGLMKEPELYPVGTNIRAKYGAVFISSHGIDTNTGEYVENSSRQASPVYMPISPQYTYWKRGTFPNRAYLSVLAFYDKDKNYISYYGKNDYGDFVIPDIPANARYARIAIPSGSYNDVKIIRTA